MGSDAGPAPRDLIATPDRHLEGLLREAARHATNAEPREAARLADRASRLCPGDPIVATLAARLWLAAGEPAEALVVLGRNEALGRTPEGGLLRAAAELALPDPAAALATVTDLLARFALEALPDLPPIADGLCRQTGRPGWLGASIHGGFAGRARPGPEEPIAVGDGDGRVVLRLPLPGATAGGWRAFSVPADSPGLRAGLVWTLGGAALIGGEPATWPPGFGLQATVRQSASRLVGTATLGWAPALPVTLCLTDGQGRNARLQAGPGEFALQPADLGLAGPHLAVSALLPDGSTGPLLGSPLAWDRAAPAAPTPLPEPPPRQPSRPVPPRARVAIVVPAYDGLAETLDCLRSVIATVPPHRAEIIAIDDASPDPALSRALRTLADSGRITLLVNPRNLGFPASANRGMALRPDHDIVLLNADAEVYGDWLDRLRRTAYAAADVASATPFSNAGSIMAYPGGADSACGGDEAALRDSLARDANRDRLVELPTGVGFCLYLRRDALDEVGPFDAEAFALGYGEENDLCMRARRCGWRHLGATDVFVRHAGGRSFGTRKGLLMARNRAVLNERHRGYDALVERFVAADPLAPARRALDEARLRADPQPTVLIIAHALPGGVAHHIAERTARLSAQGRRVLTLRPEHYETTDGRCALTAAGGALTDLVYRLPDEGKALLVLLRDCRIERVELHHFLGLAPAVFDLLDRLARPYDVHLHDHSWICPRLTLLGGDLTYCGEPDLPGCEACIAAHGSELGEEIGVAALRSRSGRILAGAMRVIAPTRDLARRYRRHLGIAAAVEPWEAGPLRGRPPATARVGRIRVGLIGAIGHQKGYRILLACARDAAARDLPLEFVVIGFTEEDPALFATGRVFLTGRYRDEEVPRLLVRERIELLLYPSVTPESWCYALSHGLASGLPILGFALGAIAERLDGQADARLLPATGDPRIVNRALVDLALATRARAMAGDHKAVATAPPNGVVSARRIDLESPPAMPVSSARPEIAANVQILSLAEGLYAFTVRAAGATAPQGELALPALHVAPAPSPGQAGRLQLLGGPDAVAGWLTHSGDVLVAQVTEGPCKVALTSLSTPDSPPLSVDIRRLDQAAATTAPVALPPAQPAAAPVPAQRVLRTQIMAHVQQRGDLPFVDSAWAGCVGERLRLEAFAVSALDQLPADLIEYKAVTENGFETPWISNSAWCGTRGMGVALLGFAIRIKPAAAAAFDCEYSGAFMSGTVVGPVRNGAPCRSPAPGDALEGIQLRIIERRAVAAPAALGRIPA